MRTGRRELKEQRLGRKSGFEPAVQVDKALWRLSPRHELVRMIAGTGVGIAGGGTAMLRTRRRDISIKPNRKLDRKSSRGMLYENEELRLRTININAEVEQGQNDIKKLRRENEQLRREIWSLRDEYDKLEEILKKQKSREESEDPEDRSEEEANVSEYWDDDEDDDDGNGDGNSNDDDDDDDEDEDEEDPNNEEDANDQESNSATHEDCNKEERLENAENQKISTEKMNNNAAPTQHRQRINFDDLSVVQEEEEPKKDKRNEASTMQSPRADPPQQLPCTQTNQLPYLTSTFDKTSTAATLSGCGYQSDCAFVFPNAASSSSGFPNPMPINGNCLLMTSCPQMCPQASRHQPIISLPPHPTPTHNAGHDVAHAHSHQPRPIHLTTPPPPAGWQASAQLLAASGTPIATTKLPFVGKTQSPGYDSRTPLAKEPALHSAATSGIATSKSIATSLSSLAERRKAFFKQQHQHQQQPDTQPAQATLIADITRNGESREAPTYSTQNCIYEEKKRMERGLEDGQPANGSDLSTFVGDTPRHFFAPLVTKPRFRHRDDSPPTTKSLEDGPMAGQRDNGNSSSSEKTTSSVLSGCQGRYGNDKGSADICVSGAISYNASGRIEKGDAKAFFSSENLFIAEEPVNNGSSNGSSNPLSKSLSCQDLSARISFDERLKYTSDNPNHAKSDITLDNMGSSSKAFRSQLNVTLRPFKSPSPDIPEIPKLPSIDYKLFNNPFLQNFEQAYQNFPVRTEGPSPPTHPLSIQVSESPVSGTKYSSPVRVQPSFTGPSTSDSDYGTSKRKNIERLRLMIPPAKLLDHKPDDGQQEYHITSFETPSPRTVQVPPLTPFDIEALRRMPGRRASPVQQNPRLYQNVPFVPRGAAVYCPGQGMRMYYDTASMKVPAQTQTSPEEEDEEGRPEAGPEGEGKPGPTGSQESAGPRADQGSKKRRSRKEKSASVKEKRKSQGSQKRRDQLAKQPPLPSKDTAESPPRLIAHGRLGEVQDDKNESRSSSSGQESPRKEQTKRVSLYFSAKKRPSISSARTSRSRSVENTKERILTRDGTLEGNATNSERERTNSISSREVGVREKMRKASTGSGNVPWCACWGNGCI